MTSELKCTWQWLKLLCIAFGNFNLIFSMQFTKLQRHSTTSVRLTNPYKATGNIPLTCCSMLCHDDPHCASINHNRATKTCEMNEMSSRYGIVELMTEQNWDVYNVVQEGCSKGWLDFAGSCYWFETEQKENWTTAFCRCAALNATLVKVESESEDKFIKTELQKLQLSGRFWMAGNDLDEENKWVWAEMNGEVIELSAGGVVEFADWAYGEPNNFGGEQHCMFMADSKYKWDDGGCSYPSYYICEV